MFCFVFSYKYFTLYFTFLDLFSQLHFMEKNNGFIILTNISSLRIDFELYTDTKKSQGPCLQGVNTQKGEIDK